MQPNRFALLYIPIFLAGLVLAACSNTSSPALIAVQPRSTPIAIYPEKSNLIYQAYLELLVDDVDYAADQAAEIAYRYGGYLAGSNSWYSGGQKLTTLDLAVPTVNFERLRLDLHSLGTVVSENLSGQTVDSPPTVYPPEFSTISVHLRPGPAIWPTPVPPDWNPGGWNPAVTFRRALAVFTTIFGFLVDILIWVVVVAGPFILAGYLVYWFIRRLRRIQA